LLNLVTRNKGIPYSHWLQEASKPFFEISHQTVLLLFSKTKNKLESKSPDEVKESYTAVIPFGFTYRGCEKSLVLLSFLSGCPQTSGAVIVLLTFAFQGLVQSPTHK
jgi:hypothetical protein